MNSSVVNNNLAIANRSRVSCAHGYVEGINSNRVTLKSRLRVTQGHQNGTIQKLGMDMLSCKHSIVTMAASLAISEIFSDKEWPDLEIWVCGG